MRHNVFHYYLQKKGKSFRTAETVKECAIEVAKAIGENEVANNFKNISLSHLTVATRVHEIDSRLEDTLKEKFTQYKYWSVALNESTNICDINQLSIFIKLIDYSFNVTTKPLVVKAMSAMKTGKDIFQTFDTVVGNFIDGESKYEKLSTVCTDGAPAMCGQENGMLMN